MQQTNCHPFRHDRWLFMHNGYINEFATLKRDLALAIDPSLYPQIQEQADSEVLFHLALTFGLKDDQAAAVERAVGLVETLAERHEIPTLRKLYPNREVFQEVSEKARLIVSEPLSDVVGVWNEVPESSWGVSGPDREEMRSFRPKQPPVSVPVSGLYTPEQIRNDR